MPGGRPCSDRTGQRTGLLVAIERAANSDRGIVQWLCQCDCGNTKIIPINHWNDTQSCGCLRIEGQRERGRQNSTHGMTGTPTYVSWKTMIQRCTAPSAPNWRYYGGRGITVCRRWRKFENFFADMGERPPGLTLDRINPNGNYTPCNCRWATRSEQRRNQRKGVMSP